MEMSNLTEYAKKLLVNNEIGELTHLIQVTENKMKKGGGNSLVEEISLKQLKIKRLVLRHILYVGESNKKDYCPIQFIYTLYSNKKEEALTEIMLLDIEAEGIKPSEFAAKLLEDIIEGINYAFVENEVRNFGKNKVDLKDKSYCEKINNIFIKYNIHNKNKIQKIIINNIHLLLRKRGIDQALFGKCITVEEINNLHTQNSKGREYIKTEKIILLNCLKEYFFNSMP